jgi:hypothetical protein
MTRTIVPSLFLVAACSSNSSKPVTNVVAPEPVLAITELKFYEGDKLGMELHPDGSLRVLDKKNGVESWKTLGTLAADGSVKPIVPAKPGGKLGADGTFTSPSGQVAPFKVEADALVIGDKKLTLGADGVFAMNGATANPPVRVEGATDAKSRKTALFVLGIVMMTGVQVEESVEAAPAVPAPAP